MACLYCADAEATVLLQCCQAAAALPVFWGQGGGAAVPADGRGGKDGGEELELS